VVNAREAEPEPDLIDLEAVVVAVEGEEGSRATAVEACARGIVAAPRLNRSGTRSPERRIVRVVDDVVGVADRHVAIDFQAVQEGRQSGDRLRILLRPANDALRFLEVAALLGELFLLRVDLLLQPLHEAPHLGELGLNVITRHRGADPQDDSHGRGQHLRDPTHSVLPLLRSKARPLSPRDTTQHRVAIAIGAKTVASCAGGTAAIQAN
jgi:hypothetical protein